MKLIKLWAFSKFFFVKRRNLSVSVTETETGIKSRHKGGTSILKPSHVIIEIQLLWLKFNVSHDCSTNILDGPS